MIGSAYSYKIWKGDQKNGSSKQSHLLATWHSRHTLKNGLQDVKEKIMKLLEEYQSGGGLDEACRCIRDIGMPFFNHEVVKKGLIMAMEKKSDRMLDLLQECNDEGVISVTQMTEGFGRVKDVMDDLVLDIPKAAEIFDRYVPHAKKNNWINDESTSTK